MEKGPAVEGNGAEARSSLYRFRMLARRLVSYIGFFHLNEEILVHKKGKSCAQTGAVGSMKLPR